MYLKQKVKANPYWYAWIGILLILILSGIVCGLIVFTKGLSVTNLTDRVPWGLWITIDLCSIAVSAGAFSLCALVYILGLRTFQPVARTATFIGLIGYTMALLSLLLDIGKPERFWHAMVYWNKHSLLWEVTMCVTLYLGVLIFECVPIFARFERLKTRYPSLAEKMLGFHRFAPSLAIIGLCLSLLHQSSLGALYGVLKARPYWFRPDISVLFIISAVAAGISLTVFLSMLSSRISKKIVIDDGILERLSYFVGWILVAYTYLRFWDALSMTYTYEPGRSEGLNLLVNGPLSFNFWVGEIILGLAIPIFILLRKKTREMPFWRMLALILVVGGMVAYRWDTNISGLLIVMSYLPGNLTVGYSTYVPSWIEVLSGLGILAYGALGFTLGVKYLSVINHEKQGIHSLATRIVEPISAD
jgi:menaquinone reductase, integral membrane subunit